MSTEEDFLSALRESFATNPYTPALTLMLVFSDWLQDRDDPKAEGYRALGVRSRWPVGPLGQIPWGWWASADTFHSSANVLPSDWFTRLAVVGGEPSHRGLWPYISDYEKRGLEYCFGGKVDLIIDVAARAFITLPPPRKAELID